MSELKASVIDAYNAQIASLTKYDNQETVIKTIERLKMIVNDIENDTLIGMTTFTEADARILWKSLNEKNRTANISNVEKVNLIFDDFLKNLKFTEPTILPTGVRQYEFKTTKVDYKFLAQIILSDVLENFIDIKFYRLGTNQRTRNELKTAFASISAHLIPPLVNVETEYNLIIEIFKVIDDSLKYMYRHLKLDETPSQSLVEDYDIAYSFLQDNHPQGRASTS